MPKVLLHGLRPGEVVGNRKLPLDFRGRHECDRCNPATRFRDRCRPVFAKPGHDANIRKAIRLIARVPTLITDGWRILQGEQPFPEKPELTLAANFFYKFNGKIPEQWQTRMLDTIFNLYADHEFNASTFAARVTASTLADMQQ